MSCDMIEAPKLLWRGLLSVSMKSWNCFEVCPTNICSKVALRNTSPVFASAALSTYKNEEVLDQLQQKFFIPDDTRFTENAYLQSASELTVASYVRGRGVSDFDTEKNVNESNRKDVDVYYRVGSTRVCLEVKCPFEEPPVSGPRTWFCLRGILQAVLNVSANS
jgi:hypothetical protein